ncbi:MAG: histone deacetylase [Hymenobacteraceae bacterium]|nr:histone deacetylase [Hymenobacteraceae bacterium]
MLRIAWSPCYRHALPAEHRFPMAKYEFLPEQLLHQGIVAADAFFGPSLLAEAPLLAVHTDEYWHRLRRGELTPAEVRKTGFPWSSALVERELVIAEGTRQCCEFALRYGVAANIAGGTHHAYAGHGEGFCLLNDQAIAARWLLDEARVDQILIVDLDVHQGNGTAAIFAAEPRVYTFSMHGATNYPARKEKSDLDVALPDGTADTAYLKLLYATLPRLLDEVRPDVVFYLAGVDVLATDKLGKLALSIAGCFERDRFVFQTCYGATVPVVTCMGGGYSPRLADILDAHANTFRAMQEVWG